MTYQASYSMMMMMMSSYADMTPPEGLPKLIGAIGTTDRQNNRCPS